MKTCFVILLILLTNAALSSEEDTLRQLQELDDSHIEFDFYQDEDIKPTDEQTLIEALELLESTIDSSTSLKGDSEQLIDPIESLTLDQENLDSQLLETLEDEVESSVEQGLEDEFFEILEEEFEEPEEILNEDIIDNEFGEINDVQ